MKVVQCGIHGFHEVLGIDVNELRFYWKLESESQNGSDFQSAYRVVVAEDSQDLVTIEGDGKGETLFWDSRSRRQPSEISFAISLLASRNVQLLLAGDSVGRRGCDLKERHKPLCSRHIRDLIQSRR
jgi:hypothetical protein